MVEKTSLEFLKLKAERIERGAFNGLGCLLHLDLSSSGSLERVGSDLLAGLATLRELNLSYCSIGAIEEHALDALVSLQHLDISGNELSEFVTHCEPRFVNVSFNKQLSSVAFRHGNSKSSRSIEEADLSWCNLNASTFNSIFELEQQQQQQTTRSLSIKRLDLSWNQIGELGAHAFSTMTSLQTLIVYGNRVDEVSREAFAGLTSLESLFLSVRALKCLQPGTFRHLANLKTLEIVKSFQSLPFSMLSFCL